MTGHLIGSMDPPVQLRNVVRFEYILFKLWLVLSDLILTYLAFQAAYSIRFVSGLPFFMSNAIPLELVYKSYMLLVIPVWVAIFAGMGLYHSSNLLGGIREYSLLLNATTVGMFLIISLGFLFPDDLILARGWVILAWFFTFMFTAAGRFVSRRLVYTMRKQGHFQVPAILVGINYEGELLVEQFQTNPTSGMRLIGYISENTHPNLNGNLKWVGKLSDLDALIEKYNVGEIILTSSALSQENILSIFRKYGTMRDVNLRMSSGLYEIITTGIEVKEVGLVPLVTINKVRMTGTEYALKQIMDYAIAIPLSILLLPLFAIVALLVKLDSPGPIIHRRRVMGVNGRQFDAFKFRTMYQNGDEILKNHPELMDEYEANFKIKNDPRVTRVGQFLRKTSLDELPQIYNVLRNEMSVVGPRMITPEELNKYHQWDINLLTVKPGITGMWQVRGRSDVSYEERVRLDMFYIRNWTAWLDLQLLVQTVPAVLTKRGAY
jgi:exopolysaccharide biosynthesis polyprenyl glycosylphosphotransferase